jgi:hypothetical protein
MRATRIKNATNWNGPHGEFQLLIYSNIQVKCKGTPYAGRLSGWKKIKFLIIPIEIPKTLVFESAIQMFSFQMK